MKKRYTVIFLIILLFLIIFISLTQGKLSVTPIELLNVLTGTASRTQTLLVLEFRLPRIVVALLSGMCLAVSGAILQSVTRNPLADPGILGINAGAGLGVLIYLGFFSGSIYASFLLPIMSFLGALASVLLIFLASYKIGIGMMPVRMILTGFVCSIGISALTILLASKIDSEKYRFIALWQAGSIWGSNWQYVLLLLFVFLLLFPLVWRKHRLLDILPLGEELSISLGINLNKNRGILIAFAVILASVSVSVCGGIGFLGLLAPHIAKKLGARRHFQLLPLSMLIGAVLLLLADTIGRLLPGSGELPAGTVVAIIGAPYFLYLMIKAET